MNGPPVVQAKGSQRDGADPRVSHRQHDQVPPTHGGSHHGGEVRGLARTEVRGQGGQRCQEHAGDKVREDRQGNVSSSRSGYLLITFLAANSNSINPTVPQSLNQLDIFILYTIWLDLVGFNTVHYLKYFQYGWI